MCGSTGPMQTMPLLRTRSPQRQEILLRGDAERHMVIEAACGGTLRGASMAPSGVCTNAM